MKSVLGIDLGVSWPRIGSAVVSFEEGRWISCTAGSIVWPVSNCDPASITAAIIDFATENRILAVSLDGPQAWRDPAGDGNFVGRECERLTRTPGKTGTFGISIPRTWIRWIQTSIEVFDRLLHSGHALLVNHSDAGVLPLLPARQFYVLECFPTSTWRCAGLQPLPGHNIDPPAIRQFAKDLEQAFGLPDPIVSETSLPGSEHDNLQALVAALPAAGLLGAPCNSVPRGSPARYIGASPSTPAHRVEGLIWDAKPTARVAQSIRADLMPDQDRIKRGTRLFEYLVQKANKGDATGISYSAFLAWINGVERFDEFKGRNYLPSDSAEAILNASAITSAAGGRRALSRAGCIIQAGMDTFIWTSTAPFDRPPRAWQSPRSTIPCTREQWLSVFPEGRRLITDAELRKLVG